MTNDNFTVIHNDTVLRLRLARDRLKRFHDQCDESVEAWDVMTEALDAIDEIFAPRKKLSVHTMKYSQKEVFAITYFASILGEATSIGADSGTVAFSHPSIPRNDDGTVPYAAFVHTDYGHNLKNFAELNDNLPSDIYYQLIGYCYLNNIPVDV